LPSGSPGRQHDTKPPDIQFSVVWTWQKSTKFVLKCQESRFDPGFSIPGLFRIREILCKPVIMDITRKEGVEEEE